MRLLVGLVWVVACNGKPQALAKEPVGSATVGSGSADPAWAKDPPEVLRSKINGVNADVIVLKTGPLLEYRDVLATVEKTPGVANAEAFTFSELEIEKAGRPPQPIELKGVDPARVGRVLTLGKHMKTGTLDALATTATPPPIVLGDVLAKTLGAAIGDEVTVRARKDGDPLPREAKTTVFRVAGTFHMDFDAYDEELALAPLSTTQALLDQGDRVMGIELTVTDIKTSQALAKTIETALGGPPYQAQDWYELNQQLFKALGHKRP
jgi:lipoprotein-releasing system permease protein